MKERCIIGIDPGSNGGIAIKAGDEKTKVVKMPKDITSLTDLLEYYRDNYEPIVFLEKLSVRPDDITKGGNMGKLYRIQRMMAGYEHLKAIIEVSGVPYVMVHPMTWQSKLELRTIGVHEEKAERKRRYQEVAAKLYKEVKVTLWNADALLIMTFGRYALENMPKWIKANLPEREQNKIRLI